MYALIGLLEILKLCPARLAILIPAEMVLDGGLVPWRWYVSAGARSPTPLKHVEGTAAIPEMLERGAVSCALQDSFPP